LGDDQLGKGSGYNLNIPLLQLDESYCCVIGEEINFISSGGSGIIDAFWDGVVLRSDSGLVGEGGK
jgi:hypothetical protein